MPATTSSWRWATSSCPRWARGELGPAVLCCGAPAGVLAGCALGAAAATSARPRSARGARSVPHALHTAPTTGCALLHGVPVVFAASGESAAGTHSARPSNSAHHICTPSRAATWRATCRATAALPARKLADLRPSFLTSSPLPLQLRGARPAGAGHVWPGVQVCVRRRRGRRRGDCHQGARALLPCQEGPRSRWCEKGVSSGKGPSPYQGAGEGLLLCGKEHACKALVGGQSAARGHRDPGAAEQQRGCRRCASRARPRRAGARLQPSGARLLRARRPARTRVADRLLSLCCRHGRGW